MISIKKRKVIERGSRHSDISAFRFLPIVKNRRLSPEMSQASGIRVNLWCHRILLFVLAFFFKVRNISNIKMMETRDGRNRIDTQRKLF
jgi:hypothetical protein